MFMLLGTGLQGRRLGIVGMGAIGQALARRAKAFGMTVSYSNRSAVSPEIESRARAPSGLSLDELLATSDVVSDQLPVLRRDPSPDRRRAVRADALVGIPGQHGARSDRRRGRVGRRHCAAARSPAPGSTCTSTSRSSQPGLDELDNAVLIPHLGSATVETRAAMATLAARNTVAVLSGQPALTPVT